MMAIVCGGRNYTDANRVKQVLDAAIVKLGLWCVIEGKATGADALAREWAIQNDKISLISVEPGDNWPAAGPIRNKLMLQILLGHDGDKAVFAFPGGKGTANMCAQARGKNIRIIEIDPKR